MTFWRFVLQSYNTGCPVRPAPVVDLIDGWDAALTQTQHPSPFGDILQALGFGQPETLYGITKSPKFQIAFSVADKRLK